MSRTSQFLFAAAAALFAAGVAAHPGHAQISPPTVVHAEQPAIGFDLFRGQRIFLDGKINGAATGMMLDSGAGMTVLDREFARRLGIEGKEKISVQGAAGSVPGEIATGVELEVGGLKLTNLSVMVFDLSPVARAIGRPIPAVLGREAFKAGVVTIDFPRQTIRFSAKGSAAAPPSAARLPLDEDGGLPTVELSIAGQPPITAHFDLGNGGTVLLSKSYWANRPEINSLKLADSQTGGVGGLRPARKATLPSVEFAGIRFDKVPAVLNEDPAALPREGGNLGLEMLKPFVVTIDTPGGAMYLQQTAKRMALKRERAGLRTELADDRLKVAFVSKDGPAAAAGLKAGDEIIAVDGRAVTNAYYQAPDWIYAEAGRKVELTRADGSKVILTLQDYY